MRNMLTILLIFLTVSLFAQELETTRVEAGQYAVRTYLANDSTIIDHYSSGRTIYYFDSITSVNIVDTIFSIAKESDLDTILTFPDLSPLRSAWALDSEGEWRDSILIPYDDVVICRDAGVGVPVLNGANLVTNWVADTGSVWKAQLTYSMNHLIINDVAAPISAFPETGWLNVDTVNVPNKQIISSHISDKGIDWTGAYIGEQAVAWSAEYRKIVSVNGDTLTYTGDDIYALSYTDSFRIVNAKEAMTFAGSWYFDMDNLVLYWWPPNSDNPSNYMAEASFINTGIYGTGVNNIVVKDIIVKNYTTDGINFYNNCDHIHVNGNALRNNYECGININDNQASSSTNNSNINILYNTVVGSNKNGISTKGDTVLIQDNAIDSICLISTHNWKGMTATHSVGNGIACYPSTNLIVKWNRINTIGYNGISFQTLSSYGIVTENVIRNHNEEFRDGGAIYTNVHTGIDSVEITKNIIFNDIQKTGSVIGVYLDSQVTGVKVKNNTIWNNKQGIHTNNIIDCTISGNTLFNNNGGVSGSANLSTREFNSGNNGGYNLFANNICISDATSPNRSVYIVIYDLSASALYFLNNIFGMSYNTDIFYYKMDAPPIFHSGNTISDLETDLGQSNIATRPDVNYSNVKLFYNANKYAVIQDLSGNTWKDLNGDAVTSLTLQPFTSKILVAD